MVIRRVNLSGPLIPFLVQVHSNTGILLHAATLNIYRKYDGWLTYLTSLSIIICGDITL